MMYKIKINQSEKVLKLSTQGGNIFINELPFHWDIKRIDDNSFHIIQNHKTYTAHLVEIDQESKTFKLQLNGKIIDLNLQDKMDLLLEDMGIEALDQNQLNDIKAPMPGLIIEVMVKVGDQVKKGDPLLILEAMKMENVIKSPGDGVISAIKANKGESVEKNHLIIQF